MTIAEKTTSARNDYVGNGARTEFPFTFEVLNEANSSTGKNYTLKVLVDDVEKTEDTDYTVSYDSSTRLGSITFTTAPASSAVITLLSQIALTQSTDYINIGTGAFPADSHEGTVDKLTLIARELDEKIDRSILLPESSTLSNVTIPVSTANASKFITVNGDGNDLTASEIADTVGSPVSTYIKTLLDDETAAAARTTLDAEQKANSLTEITSLQDADQFIIADNSDSDNSKKVTRANLFQGINQLNLNQNTATISSGAITYSGAHMVIDTEGAASSDDLDTISGGSEGDILILRLANSSRNVVIKDSTGNIETIDSRDLTLDFAVVDSITFIYTGSVWVPIARQLDNDFLNSKATDSYTFLPNGIVLQFGSMTAGGGFQTETFPVAFPNTCIFVQPLQISSLHRDFNVDILSATQFRAEAIGTASTSVRYFAIGY